MSDVFADEEASAGHEEDKEKHHTPPHDQKKKLRRVGLSITYLVCTLRI